MKCHKCNGTGRRPEGFYTFDCGECSATGYLNVDAVWLQREAEEKMRNERQYFDWVSRKIKYSEAA